MASETRIEGLSELQKALTELPQKIEANIMRGALTAAMRKMQAIAKEKVPTDNGDLKKSIKVRADRKALRRRGQVKVSLSAGDKTAFYAHMIEYGTATYYTGNGRTVGKSYEITPKVAGSLFFGGIFRDSITHPGIKPQPFMRPALDQGQSDALATVRDYVAKRLAKEAAKK